jgi:outer membrane protein assembly factor BamA
MRRLNHTTAVRLLLLPLLASAAGCSTTAKLPEGEVLYTGIKQYVVRVPEGEVITPEAAEQVDETLEVEPNSRVLGIPVPPFGLWMYNLLKTDKEKGLKHWLFTKLAADPVLISKVEPDVRAKAAQTLMDDNGYFDGKVSYEIVPDPKNARKAKISYFIDYNYPYRYKSVEFMPTGSPADSLIREIGPESELKPGDIFNVNTLEDERTRISDYLRNKGFYFFNPDFISYVADSTEGNHTVALRVVPKTDLPAPLLRPWRVGQIRYNISSPNGGTPNDSVRYKDIDVFYRWKLPVRPKILRDCLAMQTGDLYSQTATDNTQAKLNRLNTFRYTEVSYMPADTSHTIDSLNVTINATLELPIDSEIELNITTKSNKQTGPGVGFNVTRRNVFGGGETLSLETDASYEWQTGGGAKNTHGGNLINSYEFGVTSSLALPRLIAPRFFHRDFKYAATTTFKLNANLLSRAGFFRLMTLGGSANYDFKSSPVSSHTVTPFSLQYSYLMQRTGAFDSVMNENKALAQSFENQFIPSMGYTYTYDNSSVTGIRNHTWVQGSITQAGNILYGVMKLCGDKGDPMTMFGRPFSQFLKLTGEVRHYFKLTDTQVLATRLMGGVAKPYGNSSVVPYSEQFYIGGANSIRAFSVRSIGPGSYHPSADALYSYLDQTGNLKLEANVEYRFPLVSILYGAVFLDAGNVWLLKKDEARPGGNFTWSTFGRDIALGTGVGVRLDMTYIVLRFDVGVPLHDPYDTGKSGYYNVTKVWKELGYHLAIGYPF